MFLYCLEIKTLPFIVPILTSVGHTQILCENAYIFPLDLGRIAEGSRCAMKSNFKLQYTHTVLA